MDRQQQLQRTIERWIENFKKIGRNNLTAAKIRTRIQSLKEAWIEFQDGHLILQRTPTTDVVTLAYFKENMYDRIEEIYMSALDLMSECLEEVEPRVSFNESIDQRRHRPNELLALSNLPPINLTPYDGNYEQWESFRDKFTSLIINNTDLSNFARMHYLTSCLRGKALECIDNLPVTSDSFQIAWRTLKARFENKKRLLNRHMSTLLNLTPIARESADDLQSLCDKINAVVSSLNNLNRTPEQLWYDILVYIVSQKLDPITRKAWQFKASDNAEPSSFDDLNQFLASRTRGLEDYKQSNSSQDKSILKNPNVSKVNSASAVTNSLSKCLLCNSKHFINVCPKFLSKSPSQRREIIKQATRCFNCLSKKHSVMECKSKYTCRICQKKHHTLLHVGSDSSLSTALESPSTSSNTHSSELNPTVMSLCTCTKAKIRSHVLLATAWIRIGVPSGRSIIVRALLDQGSEMTFITENLAQLLRVKRIRMPIEISAVGCVSAGTYQHAAPIIISSRDATTPAFTTRAHILNALTAYVPESISHDHALSHLEDLPWADYDPTSSDPISVIVGADIFGDLLLEGVRKGLTGQPIAQKTILGWIISGPRKSALVTSQTSSAAPGVNDVDYCMGSGSLDQAIRKFWESEELPREPSLSPQDEQCETHFQRTHSRDADGRYIVRLPFKDGPPIKIGESVSRAQHVLTSLHRRLQKSPEQKKEYSEFLQDYESSGHMREIPSSSVSDNQCVYIPHHPVIRESSITTRLRVVFNASSITTNGSSLNDHLLTGPKLQLELSSVMLQWRQYRYVYSADIKQMYRQIKIDKRDVNYQRILWSPNFSESLRTYQLLTVTYGMASAPFLALRVLKQLIIDEGKNFPLAVSVLREKIYVDDVLFGEHNPQRLKQTRAQLRELLARGGFELRKWASNSPDLLDDIDAENHGLACHKLLQADDQLKILGVAWHPMSDDFQLKVALTATVPQTKRAILSAIAKLFDPLGWVTPVTINAKILIQQLWRIKLEWDDEVPSETFRKWHSIYSSLSSLNGLKIPRWTGQSDDIVRQELHGFADASSLAYAAVVYIKIISKSGQVKVTFIAGKSKVAPVTAMSIPRLELSAAVLLARLINFVQSSLGLKTTSCICWTDSTVVLAWLSQHSSKWKTFVANRVAEVQQRLPKTQWRHVPTTDNPADCASRGLLGTELVSHKLWWLGPSWLPFPEQLWPSQPPSCHSDSDAIREIKKVSSHLCKHQDPWDLSTRYSSWIKLIYVTTYIMRFVKRCRKQIDKRTSPCPRSTALSADECQAAKMFWFKRIQAEIFPGEIQALSNHQQISAKSSLLSLLPIVDEDGLLRVGGRLREAPISYNQKHPIILASHPLLKIMIEHTHSRMLHAGLQLMLSTLRQNVWILRARSIVKSVLHRCVRCAREKAAIPLQLMGNLPRPRVSAPSRSFLHCGLDYAGPINIRASAIRSNKVMKVYIALFVCLATKAIHLELVGNYSTQAFLDAFSRFCARRGIPQSMYSDNGTTFIGADRELALAYRSAIRDPAFLNKTASDHISWHFIPPSAPHFGGLWEAGIRSVKHHLRRVVGCHVLTFEELTTLLCRIEACMNSRPIAPLHDTADDLAYLTPSHFLIGSAISVPPEPSILELNENRLSRWQLVRQLTERFWKVWQNDYLNTLQQRVKWRRMHDQINTGQLVLMRNNLLPPCKWELGRISNCHPGSDGVIRVVTVKTATSEYKRPIGKLCLLPIDIENLREERQKVVSQTV